MSRPRAAVLSLALAAGLIVIAAYSSYRRAYASAQAIVAPYAGGIELADRRFMYGTLPEAGRRAAWVFTYTPRDMPEGHGIDLYLSLSGDLLATNPRLILERLGTWHRPREP